MQKTNTKTATEVKRRMQPHKRHIRQQGGLNNRIDWKIVGV